MIETQEKEINGNRYSVTQMTARRALRMKAKLLKQFGTALAEIFLPSEDKPIEGAGFSKKEAVSALQALSCELDERAFELLVMELLSGVRKDGVELTEAIVDMEFAGDLATLFKVIWFVLEVNFSSFFGESGIGEMMQASAVPQKKAFTKGKSAKK